MEFSVDNLSDFIFNVIPLPLRENPQDEYFLEYMFSFDITCTTLVVPSHVMTQNYEEDYDDSWILDADSEIVEHNFFVERRRLLDDPEDVSKSTLVRLLASKGIDPVEDYMVDNILRVVRHMEREYSYLGRKVLHLEVQYVDFLPSQESNNNNSVRAEDEEFINNVVGGSLEKVRVVVVGGEDEKLCAICLENILFGSDATELPCSHLYHGGCIRKWLEKRSDCPLCRKRLVPPS